MEIGALIDVDRPLPEQIEQVAWFDRLGLASGWGVQIFGRDTLTSLAVIGSTVARIPLGTAVIPVHPRHPQILAQQARTVQEAVGGRLTLGVGLSHQMVVEGMWGYGFDRPARYMREYLSVLVPMLRGEAVDHHGELLTAVTIGPVGPTDVAAPSLLVAALGPVMLGLAGRVADGTVTWMTGTRTVGAHVVPTISAAAEQSGRAAPRVVVSLPVLLTTDVEAGRTAVDEAFGFYPGLPSYRAMLDREGAEAPSDIALIGDEAEVAKGIQRLVDAGATEFVAAPIGRAAEQRRTVEFLADQH